MKSVQEHPAIIGARREAIRKDSVAALLEYEEGTGWFGRRVEKKRQ